MTRGIIDDRAFDTLGRAGSRWVLENHEGVALRPTVEAELLRLEITGAHGANWHGELRYTPFAVAVGDVFELGFEARAERAFTFSVWLGQRDAPHASLVEEEDRFQGQWMTPEWQKFRHRWRAVAAEGKARLNFALGQIDNVVEIRNVGLSVRGNAAST